MVYLTLFISVTQSCPILCDPWTAARQASLFIMTSWSLLKLMSTESLMPSNHLILCHPPLLLPSIFSNIRVFSNELALHIRWPKHWSFRFSIRPSNGYSELISFRIDLFDLLAVQETLTSLHYQLLCYSLAEKSDTFRLDLYLMNKKTEYQEYKVYPRLSDRKTNSSLNYCIPLLF